MCAVQVLDSSLSLLACDLLGLSLSSASHHICSWRVFQHVEFVLFMFFFIRKKWFVSHRVTLFSSSLLCTFFTFCLLFFPKYKAVITYFLLALRFECSVLGQASCWLITWRSVRGYMFATTHRVLSGFIWHFLFGFHTFFVVG